MTRWWRAYEGAVDDPKLQLLSDSLFRAWFNVLCIASRNDGRLPGNAELAFGLRVKPEKAAEIVTKLHRHGLLDKDDQGFKPHNWDGRQYRSDTADPTGASRAKRYRDAKKNVTRDDRDASRDADRNATVSEKRPETDTEAEIEKKTISRAGARVDDWPSDYGDRFWAAFPKRVEKLAAMKKLEVVRKSGVTFAELLAGVQRYATSVQSTDPQYIKAPVAWLNAGRWADEIPTGGSHANRGPNPRATERSPLVAAAHRKAQQFFGEDTVAGSADAMGPTQRTGAERDRAPGFAGPLRGAGDGSGGFEFDGATTIEGEARACDEARGGLGNGPDVGFRSRRSA